MLTKKTNILFFWMESSTQYSKHVRYLWLLLIDGTVGLFCFRISFFSPFATFSFKEATATYTERKSFSVELVPCIPWNLNEKLASNPFSFLCVHHSPVLNDLFMQWSWLSVLVRWWMCWSSALRGLKREPAVHSNLSWHLGQQFSLLEETNLPA